MNTLEAIKTILEDIAIPKTHTSHPDDLEYQIVMDTERHHYQVIVVGWRNKRYTHGIVVQIDLRGEMVWVVADNTDYDVAGALVRLGIPKDKIVLGFHPPQWRQHTGFASGE
jgi:XisI protein